MKNFFAKDMMLDDYHFCTVQIKLIESDKVLEFESPNAMYYYENMLYIIQDGITVNCYNKDRIEYITLKDVAP